MKYWRGYLIAAIIAIITNVIKKLASTYSDLVDMVYPYLTRTVQTFLAQWSGSMDFCIWQVAVVVLVLFALATVVLMIVLRWNPIQWFGWILTGIVCVNFLSTCIYGLNYHAGPLASDIRLNLTEYTLEELEHAAVYYRDLANKLADQVERDSNGDVVFPEFEVLAQQAGEGFEALTYEYSYSVFAGSTLPVKKLGWADMYTSKGVAGKTVGITGEAAVNPEIPAVIMPFVMCREMSHRMCIAIEEDANFAAFLAGQANSEAAFQYSAYFMAYRYCYNALYEQGSADATTTAARIETEVNKNLRHDLEVYDRFFKKDKSSTYADSLVADLLVSWHIQEVVIPSQTDDEAESVFDPYDESQVDLSGIVNAKVPAEESN